mmetsp:Transcript_27881/g.49863  ORF Transcript_27881/g.49863 Transcript_27881/m.49863 type:complete len:189 (+) Transcript_27881:140-706(+)
MRATYPFHIESEFQVYCKPRVNPTLSNFCKELTAITQEQIDTSGVYLRNALEAYAAWLTGTGLPSIQDDSFTVVTWGDSDLIVLQNQCKSEGITRPGLFDRWVNLKALFKQHYRKEPRGGLQHVVEKVCGLPFEGRAHSGLVDSFNTAKICQQMLRQGFVFNRTTRGFGADGNAFGSRKPSREPVAEV